MKKRSLVISDLHVSVERKPIVKGVNITIQQGTIHALMGPNGSGKSTLAYTLMGHPRYQVTSGSIKLGQTNVLRRTPYERAIMGLFLAFQYPMEIPGVRFGQFLRTAYNTLHPDETLSPGTFRSALFAVMDELNVEKGFADRYVNDGFSGGEKKKAEVLQMRILQPKIAICDETDSGLDVDALKLVAKGIEAIVAQGTGALVITHYQRLLDYLHPDIVSVMHDGKIVVQGGAEIVSDIEKEGYMQFAKVAHA